MLKYFITIAKQGGLTPDHITCLKHYHASRFTKCVVNIEAHKSGLLHLHSYVESPIKSSNAIRKHLMRFLEENGIQCGPKTVCVKVADEGARNYVIKEVTEDNPVTLCQGWTIESLLETRREALKKLTKSQAMGTDRIIGQDEAVPLILKFAKIMATPLTDKESFKTVVKEMVKLGFSFSRLKMAIVYAETLQRCGNDHALDDWLEMQLCGMR